MPKVDKITKSFIDSTPQTEGGQVAYWDKSLSGFAVVFGKTAITFIVQKDIDGKTARYTLGRFGHLTVEEAKQLAKDCLYLMSQGINPNNRDKEERKKIVTLEEVFRSYKTTRKNLSPVTFKGYEYALNKYLIDWKRQPITNIDKDMIVSRHAMLGEHHGERTANGTMRIVRLLINHANAVYELDIKNPVEHLNKIKGWFPDKRRITYIKPHQLPAWWSALNEIENDTIRDFLTLLLFTGLRKGEAESLRWSDVDLNDHTITVTQTKNGDVLTLPLSTYLFQLFQRRYQRYGDGEFVFPAKGKKGHLSEPKKGIYRIITATGIQFSCHDLRRTFLTLAESMDISAYALKRLVNHRIASDITSSYIVSNHERLRDPVERIAQHILELVNHGQESRSYIFNNL